MKKLKKERERKRGGLLLGTPSSLGVYKKGWGLLRQQKRSEERRSLIPFDVIWARVDEKRQVCMRHACAGR